MMKLSRHPLVISMSLLLPLRIDQDQFTAPADNANIEHVRQVEVAVSAGLTAAASAYGAS